MSIEIITIGKEILTGRTLDTNSSWIAKRIFSLGEQVSRIVCVDDNLDDIAGAINTAEDRGCHILLTTGGLGPTKSDMTLEAVARAFGVSLNLDKGASDFVKQRYEYFYKQAYVDSPDMTPAREKMARIPSGSELLPNTVGAAPGVLIQREQMALFLLPGVPQEMQAIFEDHVFTYLKNMLPCKILIENKMVIEMKDESVLAAVTEEIMNEMSGVYIKSSPSRFGQDVRIEVFINASGEDKGDVEKLIENARSRLLEKLKDQ